MGMNPLLLALPLLGGADATYEKDVAFALKALEENCGRFFKLKGIDWKRVSEEFSKAAKSVRSDEEHLRLLIRLLARLRDGHAKVEPLEKGKGTRWPQFAKGSSAGPGVFLCRSGRSIWIKSCGPAAEKAGASAGLEVLKIDGLPASQWIEKRIAWMSDFHSFSTVQQAFFAATHGGLYDAEGSKLSLEVKDLKGRIRTLALSRTVAKDPPVGPATLPKDLRELGEHRYGKTSGGFGYIHFGNIPAELPAQVDRMLAEIGQVPGLVLDFRGNHGGGCDHDALFARFIPLGKRFKRTGSSEIEGAGPNPFGGPVVVIVDSGVRSTGETASGMFKEDGRAYLIGEGPTAGMSSQKKAIELPSQLFSLFVSVQSNKQRFNEGRGIEGIGVIPQEVGAYDPKDLARGWDTLILRAEDILKDFPQGKVPYRPDSFGWEK